MDSWSFFGFGPKNAPLSNVQILRTLHVHHAFWYISLHPLHTYKKNAIFPILVSRARRSLQIQPNVSGDENAYFKSIELAYLESNVRALVLLPFIGNINKRQYFKIYPWKFNEIWQKSRSYRTPVNETWKPQNNVTQSSFSSKLFPRNFQKLFVIIWLSCFLKNESY